jgi:hypothetical protein
MNIIKAVRTIDIAHTALNVPTNVVFPNHSKIVERSEYIPVLDDEFTDLLIS